MCNYIILQFTLFLHSAVIKKDIRQLIHKGSLSIQSFRRSSVNKSKMFLCCNNPQLGNEYLTMPSLFFIVTNFKDPAY